ncbi:MAG: DUF1269 domain-containing protein [Actinophytocola sp.]|uniref:DUF1269 domain-containing protein n=1 Tax=Actinophytocola sp. TaxID=1872138 RepID=UPI003C764B83
MSNLIAITYPDLAAANQARDRVLELRAEELIRLEDIVVLERRQDGKIKLHQATGSPTTSGALTGALFGGLIGVLFFVPLLGAALGAAGGAAAGSTVDTGVNDDFMRRLGAGLAPGAAALFLLITESTPDKVIPRLAPLGGELLTTSLSAEGEERLREAIDAARKQHTAKTPAP